MTTNWMRVIFSSVKALIWVGVTLGFAFIAAPYVSVCLSLSTEEVKIFRLGAMGIFAWGVMGKLGWEIQSWKENTSLERINSIWSKTLYFLGLFVGGLGILLGPVDISS